MKTSKIVWLTLLLTVPLLSGYAKKAPNFKLKEIRLGNMVELEKYRGKVVLVNFWATWCGPCVHEIPDLIKLQQAYKGKLVIIGTSVDGDSESKVKKFANDNKINYPIVMARTIRSQWPETEGIPTTFVIDKEGNIAETLVGSRDYQTFEQIVLPYINGQLTKVEEDKPVTTTTSTIIFYGRPSCGLCRALKSQLDGEKIAYEYKNIDTSANNREMWAKLNKSNPGLSRVTLPILDINGTILISPKLNDVKRAMPATEPKDNPVPANEENVFDEIITYQPIPPSGKIGKNFYDKIDGYVLVGISVYHNNVIRGICPIYESLKNKETKYSVCFGKKEGTTTVLMKKGYRIGGLQVCEGVYKGTNVIKKLAVYYKKAEEKNGDLTPSQTLGTGEGIKGDDLCMEIVPEEGETVIGLNGSANEEFINQLSVITTKLK